MFSMRRDGVALFFLCLVVFSRHTSAQNVVQGVDFVNLVLGFSEADQNAQLARIKAAGVGVIRFGVEGDVDKNIDFIKRAHSQDIKSILILHGKYPSNAAIRPYRGQEFPGMNAGAPFSTLSPELCEKYFQEIMNRLDTEGIALAGLEFENEINMAGNNPDFQLPGEGRVLGLDDLFHDPEGQQVAKGYLQYLKGLAVLKRVRDHSRINRSTLLLPVLWKSCRKDPGRRQKTMTE